MPVGLLTLTLQIPGCASLKEKRSRLRPLLARLHKEFNVSAAEMDLLDDWDRAGIACALVSNDAAQADRALRTTARWIETHWPDVEVESDQIEII
jgi:uncharacterized protein YlxP (DUF503 family)